MLICTHWIYKHTYTQAYTHANIHTHTYICFSLMYLTYLVTLNLFFLHSFKKLRYFPPPNTQVLLWKVRKKNNTPCWKEIRPLFITHPRTGCGWGCQREAVGDKWGSTILFCSTPRNLMNQISYCSHLLLLTTPLSQGELRKIHIFWLLPFVLPLLLSVSNRLVVWWKLQDCRPNSTSQYKTTVYYLGF